MTKFSEFKKFFLFTLIGSLVISALVAVITVLIGNFNEITTRVFLTLAMVLVHSLFSLVFIWDDEKQNTFERLAFFINVLFSLIAISFITCISGIWKIIPGETVWHLYETYFILAFAALHGDILSKVLSKQNYLDVIIYSNYGFIVVVILLLLPTIYITDPITTLGYMYFRILGACGIVDGTLSVLTIILYRIYMHSHPEEQNTLSLPTGQQAPTTKKGLSIWVWILIIYLTFQIITPLIGFAMYGMSGMFGR